MAQGNKKLNEDDYPRGLDLRTEDFAWLTEQLMGALEGSGPDSVDRQPRARRFFFVFFFVSPPFAAFW